MQKENGLTGNAPIPHDLWRRLVPIAREYEKGNGAIAQLYTYLLAHVNGKPDNDRYMSAFPSVEKIAEDTGIGRNRIARLANVLEAVGLLKTAYDYASNKREKLYYPQYYSALSDAEIRRRLDDIYGQSP
ncbi:helix-turn-helix domain-containing protein [Bacillus nakamurai]